MCEAESIVNSRPITPNPADPSDENPLTPNHLLHMKFSVVLPPPGKFDEMEAYSRKRWKRVQQLTDCFWKRWRFSYLVSLQNRQRWTKQKCNLKINDIVLIQDDGVFRGQWKLGRVVELLPSKDGLVRRVKVFAGSTRNTYEHPIHKLILLMD